jgi:two-component system nitrogen regulation response regulator GlnG
VITPALIEQQLGGGGQAATRRARSGRPGRGDRAASRAPFRQLSAALPPDGLYDRVLAEVERPLLRLTLAAVRGNQLKAARCSGSTATRCARS